MTIKLKTTKRRGQVALAWLCAATGVGAAAWLRPALDGAREFTPAFSVSESTQEAANSTPFAMILGEVRTSMADLMWVKTERYLHNGIAYGAHLDMNAMTESGEIKDKAAQPAPAHEAHADHAEDLESMPDLAGHDEHGHDEHDHDHAHDHEHEGEGHEDHEDHEDHHEEHHEVATLIPTAQTDFRGFVGTLQREIQPWQDPSAEHVHGGGSELLPWYRVLTIANPKHVRGYMIGSWWLTKQDTPGERDFGVKQAQGFVEEGIANNPDAFTLHIMRGRIMIAQERYAEAVADFAAARDAALKIRTPQGEVRPGIWSESDEEDFATALRMIPMLQLRKLNQPEQARVAVEEGLKFVPRDHSLNLFFSELQDSATVLHN